MDLETWLLVRLSNLFAAFSPPNFDRYQDETSYNRCQEVGVHSNFENFFKFFAPFEAKDIVDLGCGEGGKTLFYASLKPRVIIGVDVDLVKIRRARLYQRIKGEGGNAYFICADVGEMPFERKQFDLCISEDGFEHFLQPLKVLNEANRVLKNGGRFLILFAPYFTMGGPHLYNFIRVPWPHLLFTDRAMIEATRVIAEQIRLPNTPRRETPREQAEREIHQFKYFINKITLRRWKELLLKSPNWRLVCFHAFCGKRLFCPFIRAPLLCEIFTWVFCVLEKIPGNNIGREDFRFAKRNDLRSVI